MAEFWNLPDMANNIANQIWKQALTQSIAPATVNETINGGILQKLGINWVLSQAPAFYINSKQVKILHTPQSFYSLLLEQINAANTRIVLSSLYLGTGTLEKNFIHTLEKRLCEKPDLKVKVLLDCTRGSRGNINSRTMILPLLKNHKNSLQVSLFQMPSDQRRFLSFLPTKYREIIGLQHIKVYLFDDNFIITGANLSNDYFTNRQDRYMLIRNNKELSDFVEGLVDKVSEFSFQLDENNSLTLENSWKLDPLKTDAKTFNFAAYNSIKNYYDNFKSTSETSECDTVIFPLLEMGPLGIHTDSKVTTRILEQCDENFNVQLTTGYFNLIEDYVNSIIYKSEAHFEILMAHPTANGFYKAKGLAGGIPHAYTYIAAKLFEKIKRENQLSRIHMFEYERPGWTYHSKGLWLSTFDSHLPFVTMIGSPNFGERSIKRDLECQFLLATVDEELQYELFKERKFLFNFASIFTDEVLTRPGRDVPLWVKLVVLLFKSYL